MREEREKAKAALKEGVRVLMRAYTASGNSSGMDWFVAFDRSDGDTRVAGVENKNGDTVIGDCMSDVNNEVSEPDARHVALMDPRFTRMVLDMFRVAIEDIDLVGPGSPVIEQAVRMAEHLAKRWNGGMENEQPQAARDR